MAVIDHDNSIRPTSIASCKQTYILAKGWATAEHANATKAVDEAKAAAKDERDRAFADASALVCPQTCGSGRVCGDRGTTRTGSSLDWKLPVKDKTSGLWRCYAWATYSVYRHCRCRDLG